jgi:hypothetical protein
MTHLELYPKKGVNSIEFGMHYEAVRKHANCEFNSETQREFWAHNKYLYTKFTTDHPDLDFSWLYKPGFTIANPDFPYWDRFDDLEITVHYDDLGFCEFIVIYGTNIKLFDREIFLFESREFNSDDSVEILISWLDSLGGNFRFEEESEFITSDYFGISLELYESRPLKKYDSLKILPPQSISVFAKEPQKR